MEVEVVGGRAVMQEILELQDIDLYTVCSESIISFIPPFNRFSLTMMSKNVFQNIFSCYSKESKI